MVDITKFCCPPHLIVVSIVSQTVSKLVSEQGAGLAPVG